jgi:hypothetical protein
VGILEPSNDASFLYVVLMALTATVFGESRFLTTIVLVGISGIVTVLAYRKLKAKGRLPLPPGPPGLPIVGNIFDIPEEDFWWKYKEWSDQYGPSSSSFLERSMSNRG